MKGLCIELEYDLLINGEPAKIELFDADNPEYSKIEIYLTDFKSVKDMPFLQKNNLYGVLNEQGQQISEIKYKKIRLNRNVLEGKIKKIWTPLNNHKQCL